MVSFDIKIFVSYSKIFALVIVGGGVSYYSVVAKGIQAQL